MLQRLYNRMIAVAAGPNAMWALIAVSFAESSFFPIPGDVLMIPMMLAAPRKAWRIAAIATISSVVGGLLGYAIGYWGFDLIGRPILEFYHAMSRYDALKAGFDQWGAWIIIIKGLTPIPYKLVTISAGIARFDLFTFIWASVVTRGARFFIVAAILKYAGPAMLAEFERRMTLYSILLLLLLIGGFVALKVFM